MASRVYSNEELNYFRICRVTTSILPRALRTVFKQEWDSWYKASHGQWMNTGKNATDFYNGESKANQKRLDKDLSISAVKNGNIEQWDCKCLFFAILNSTSIGSKLSHIVKTNVEDLRAFRNRFFAHALEGSVLDKEFQTSTQVVIDAFKALGLCTSDVEAVKKEKTFPTLDLNTLEEQLTKEKKANQLLEEEVKTLEEEMNEKPASFCSLPPEPSHETFPRTDDVLRVLQEAEKLKKKSSEEDEVVVVYLSGNPGCGKSQVARQVGETFYKSNKETSDVFVMTLDAKNVDTVLDSYTRFAKLVGCTEYSVSKSTSKDLSKEERLTFLKTLVMSKVRCFSNWLIIVDNVTDIKSVSQCWPQPGTKEWGGGLLLVTTQDSHSVPLAYSRCHHMSLSRGMKSNEAAALLSKIANNVPSEDCRKMQELAHKLDYQPLAIACAALYVKDTGISWEKYVSKLDQGKREATEEVYESTSHTYRSPMTTAVLLAMQREVQKHDILKHAFQYIALLAPEKVALEYIARYVLVRLPKADEDIVKSKIRKSSLILVLDTNAVEEIKVHQVVHDTLKLNLFPVTSADDNCVTATVLSFGSLVSCNTKELNIIVAAQTLIAHFRHLFHTVKKIRCPRDSLSKESKMIGDCISVIGELCETYGEFEQAKDYQEKALAMRQVAYGNDHLQVADSLSKLGTVCSGLGQHDEAEDFHQQALVIRQTVHGNNHSDVAISLNNLGIVYRRLGKYDQTRDFHQRALDICQAVYGNINHPDIATSLNNLGIVHRRLGQHEKAKDYYQWALDIQQCVYGNNHPDVATSLNSLGIVYSDLGQHEQAKDFHNRALIICQDVYGNNHPDVARSLNNLGLENSFLGKHDQAKDLHQQALAIRQAVYGNGHPYVARSLNSLGTVFSDLGQHHEAEDFHKRALFIRQTVYGNNHPHVAHSLNNLGIVYSDLDQLEQSMDYHQRALAMRQAVHGGDHPHVAHSLNNLGVVYSNLGQYEQAIDFHQQALAIYQAVYSNDHPDIAMTLNNFGLVYSHLGQHRKAKDFYHQALVIRQAVYSNDHPHVAISLNSLGTVYSDLGRHEQAKDFYQRALVIYQALYDSDHLDIALAFYNLEKAHSNLGQRHQAKDFCQRALAIYQAVYGSDHPDVADCLKKLELMRRDRGHQKKARLL